MLSFLGQKTLKTQFFQESFLLTKFSKSSLYVCEQLGTLLYKTLNQFIFLKKRNFYDFLKHCDYRKLTTDFENRTKRSVVIKVSVFFWTLATRTYPTEQAQSFLQQDISTHFVHFRFECKILKFQSQVFMREKNSRKCFRAHLFMFQKPKKFVAIGPETKSTERNKSLVL